MDKIEETEKYSYKKINNPAYCGSIAIFAVPYG